MNKYNYEDPGKQQAAWGLTLHLQEQEYPPKLTHGNSGRAANIHSLGGGEKIDQHEILPTSIQTQQ